MGLVLKAGQSGPILLAQSVFELRRNSQENRRVTRGTSVAYRLFALRLCKPVCRHGTGRDPQRRPVTHLRRPVGCQGADDRIRISRAHSDFHATIAHGLACRP